ncbi:DUF4097 family beta strand repeat-containing protein [Streptomyces sp. NPDC014870]|uniref:DUF4097 family beta strand repeat-containing protein n=1 Tax=Streptomyces sp. NPDC014870 TaxID=3364925 RepID=UPI0036FB25B1
MQTFATTAPVTAVLDIPAGVIRIVAADQAEATVEVRPADPGKSRDVKAAEQTEVGYADGVLRVEVPEAKSRVLGNGGFIDVTVKVPAGSRVEAKAAAGEFRSTGPLGDVAFEGQQGTVELDEVVGARLVLQAGDVSVARLGGSAEISTQKGDIQVAEAVRGTVTLRTEAGGITVGAARGVSAALDAGTAHGRIHNSLQNSGGGAAELTVHATTAFGDITARSL